MNKRDSGRGVAVGVAFGVLMSVAGYVHPHAPMLCGALAFAVGVGYVFYSVGSPKKRNG